MKYFYTLILMFVFSFTELSAETEADQIPENEYENGCSNDLDDDMDGYLDDEDSDCTVIAAFLDDVDADDVKGILVWGVGIALLSSVGSDSGTGTATTD